MPNFSGPNPLASRTIEKKANNLAEYSPSPYIIIFIEKVFKARTNLLFTELDNRGNNQ